MLTALLATRNGERTLPRVLDALCRLQRPASGWHLVAVDNASTDRTPALLARYRGRLPLTLLHEPTPGKSIALNRALADLRDGLIVFFDDDIVPEPDWLLRYEEVAAARRDHVIFAGLIRPLWEAEPAPWLLDWADLSVCFGIHQERPEGECPDYVVYGGNMAVRAEAIVPGFGFGARFGPDDQSNYAMGGETDFAQRLIAAGHRAWHCPRAIVRHMIPASHMTEAWLLNRANNYGRGEYCVGGNTMRRLARRSDAAAVAWLRRAIVLARWRAHIAGFFGNGKGRFQSLWRMNHLIGMADEYRAAMERRRASGRSGGAPVYAVPPALMLKPRQGD
jgi:glycosyltransferase involved in cell wall biosynthesis